MHADLIAAARKAGADEVMPRSAFAGNLADILRVWRETALTSIADIVERRAPRIHGLVLRTPLRRSDWLSQAAGADVSISSWKSSSPPARTRFAARSTPRCAFAEAAAGDGRAGHGVGRQPRPGAGLRRARSGLPLMVFIPANAPRAKIDAIRAAGAELTACATTTRRSVTRRRHARDGGGVYISPYSHPT